MITLDEIMVKAKEMSAAASISAKLSTISNMIEIMDTHLSHARFDARGYLERYYRNLQNIALDKKLLEENESENFKTDFCLLLFRYPDLRMLFIAAAHSRIMKQCIRTLERFKQLAKQRTLSPDEIQKRSAAETALRRAETDFRKVLMRLARSKGVGPEWPLEPV
jgi:hypothetical protein